MHVVNVNINLLWGMQNNMHPTLCSLFIKTTVCTNLLIKVQDIEGTGGKGMEFLKKLKIKLS